GVSAAPLQDVPGYEGLKPDPVYVHKMPGGSARDHFDVNANHGVLHLPSGSIPPDHHENRPWVPSLLRWIGNSQCPRNEGFPACPLHNGPESWNDLRLQYARIFDRNLLFQSVQLIQAFRLKCLI